MHLTALTHNLLTLLLVTLESTGCPQEKVERVQRQRRKASPSQQRIPAHEMVRHAGATDLSVHPAGAPLPRLQSPLARGSAPHPSQAPLLLIGICRTPMERQNRVRLTLFSASEMILQNARDGSRAYWIDAGLYRLVCRNGLTVADADFAHVSIRHVAVSADAFAKAAQSVRPMMQVLTP